MAHPYLVWYVYSDEKWSQTQGTVLPDYQRLKEVSSNRVTNMAASGHSFEFLTTTKALQFLTRHIDDKTF
jgi:hypothetical protein